MKKLMHIAAAGLITLFSATMSQQASADVVVGSNRTTADVYSDGTLRYLPLNNSGSTQFWFYNASSSNIAITFSAECSVAANDNFTWYNIDVLLDGAALPPTDSDNALCTSHANGALGNWVSAAVTTYKYSVPAGWHSVRVRGNLVGYSAGESVRLDDVSVVVLR